MGEDVVCGGKVSDVVVGISVKFDQKNLLGKDILHLGISTRFHVRNWVKMPSVKECFAPKILAVGISTSLTKREH